MRRSLIVALFVAQFMVFEGTPCLFADEPATYRPSQRRAAIERMLDSPLEWELGDRESVTLAELINYIREKHQLQVRWDMGSLGLVFGEDAPLGELLSTSGAAKASAPQIINGLPTYPGTRAPSVTPYAAPQSAGGAATPSGQGPSYATAPTYSMPNSEAKIQDTIPVREEPGTGRVVPDNVAKQQPTPQVTYDRYVAPSSETTSQDQPVPDAPAESGPAATIAKYQDSPISLSTVSLERATVREALQQLLSGVSTHTSSIPFQAGLPITTRALALDLLVDENSVLITTQLRANSKKETRIYRLGSLSEIPVESLERVITHSIRPWSWRNQANEIAEKLASQWPKSSVPLPNIAFNAMDGITLKPADGDAALTAAAMPKVSADAIAATGQLVAGGTLALVNSIVAGLEIVHHGDPPTGVIESLPGILIITQSQGAHREIKELLYELGEEQ